MSIAQTILKQLGGAGIIAAFTGAKHFITYEDGVSFRFPNRASGKPNFVKITLNGLDLYDVEFKRIYGTKVTPIESVEGVYNSQLVSIFERVTGLYLSF